MDSGFYHTHPWKDVFSLLPGVVRLVAFQGAALPPPVCPSPPTLSVCPPLSLFLFLVVFATENLGLHTLGFQLVLSMGQDLKHKSKVSLGYQDKSLALIHKEKGNASSKHCLCSHSHQQRHHNICTTGAEFDTTPCHIWKYSAFPSTSF